MPRLRFHGAAGEVTGSMHMIEFDGKLVALDCGLHQGRRSESEDKNREWPCKPGEIDAVVLSHAHIDHCGRLPRLVKDGFDGPIFSTPATRDLCAIMLPDSAHIQEEDVYYVNKRRKKKGLDPIEPLYGYDEALAAIEMFQTVSFKRWFQVVPGLLAQYQDAGHMLGSGGVTLAFADRHHDGAPNLYFTGDIGRPDKPILRDPRAIPPCDVLICESTYGDRVNERVFDAKAQLVDIVKRTYARGGKVIIPAFSVGRTQTIVYFMHEQMVAGELPRQKIYVDSPLAVNATEVFKMHPECYDAEARAFYKVTGDILGHKCVTYIRDVEESKALHREKGPFTIISASGMVEAGRIRHHIKNNIGSEKNTILFSGYQASHTLGRKILDGAKEIRLFHEDYPVRAEIAQLHGFSGHADQNDLLNMLTPLKGKVGQTFLVHGEPDASGELKRKLDGLEFGEVTVAQRGMEIEF